MKTIQKGFTLIELMIVVAIIAILAAIAIPAYQNYLIRAQVSEAPSLMSAAQTGMTEYFANNGTFPTTPTSAGLPSTATSTSGAYVSQVTLVAGTGGGVIRATFANNGVQKANAAIAGSTLELSPIAEGGSVAWTCKPPASGGVPNQYLPTSCRNT